MNFEDNIFRKNKKLEGSNEIVFMETTDLDGNVTERHDVVAGNSIVTFDEESILPEQRDAAKKWYEENVHQGYLKSREGSLDLSQELGPAFQEKIEALRAFIAEHYKKLGIERVFIAPIRGAINKENETERGAYLPGSAFTQIDMCSGITYDQDIREMAILTLAIHESTHSTGLIQVEVSSNGEEFITRPQRMGAGASNYVKGKGSGSILEEASAVRMQVAYFNKFIEAHYPPKKIENYKRFIQAHYRYKNILEEFEKDPEYAIATSIIKVLSKTDKENVFTLVVNKVGYGECYKILKILEKNIPDFENKLAQSRIFGNDIPLQEVIDKKYGQGFYKRLRNSNWSNTEEFLGVIESKE